MCYMANVYTPRHTQTEVILEQLKGQNFEGSIYDCIQGRLNTLVG